MTRGICLLTFLLRGGFSRVELAARMWTSRRVGGLEATSNVGIEGRELAFLVWRPPQFLYASRKRRRAAKSRSRRKPHGLTASLTSIGFCSAKAGSSQEPLGAETQTGAASPALCSKYAPPVVVYLTAASRHVVWETELGQQRRALRPSAWQPPPRFPCPAF